MNTRLTKADYDTAVELAKLPIGLRGFGHVKDQARHDMQSKKVELTHRIFGADGQKPDSQAAE